ncbi:tRNA-His guanylyltransferase [Geranomyces michiganensis]|nr:tRNA-His guanylyltransferase [Geranomyces michiganensis]
MACSKFEYVRLFEQHTALLPNTFLVVRLDGHAFHRFTAAHAFAKPNDARCLRLMAHAATHVLETYPDITLAYGQSDEFSFALNRRSTLYKRREAKIATTICSLFTAAFCCSWAQFMQGVEMKYPPSFDARVVCYPTEKNLRDYFAWRQADCHVNNLYNTAFWALVQDPTQPCTEREAQALLKDTNSAAKNELLFQRFGINYNKLDEIYKKGSVLFRKPMLVKTLSSRDGVTPIERTRSVVVTEHRDVIGDEFWEENAYILDD